MDVVVGVCFLESSNKKTWSTLVFIPANRKLHSLRQSLPQALCRSRVSLRGGARHLTPEGPGTWNVGLLRVPRRSVGAGTADPHPIGGIRCQDSPSQAFLDLLRWEPQYHWQLARARNQNTSPPPPVATLEMVRLLAGDRRKASTIAVWVDPGIGTHPTIHRFDG